MADMKASGAVPTQHPEGKVDVNKGTKLAAITGVYGDDKAAKGEKAATPLYRVSMFELRDTRPYERTNPKGGKVVVQGGCLVETQCFVLPEKWFGALQRVARGYVPVNFAYDSKNGVIEWRGSSSKSKLNESTYLLVAKELSKDGSVEANWWAYNLEKIRPLNKQAQLFVQQPQFQQNLQQMCMQIDAMRKNGASQEQVHMGMLQFMQTLSTALPTRVNGNFVERIEAIKLSTAAKNNPKMLQNGFAAVRKSTNKPYIKNSVGSYPEIKYDAICERPYKQPQAQRPAQPVQQAQPTPPVQPQKPAQPVQQVQPQQKPVQPAQPVQQPVVQEQPVQNNPVEQKVQYPTMSAAEFSDKYGIPSEELSPKYSEEQLGLYDKGASIFGWEGVDLKCRMNPHMSPAQIELMNRLPSYKAAAVNNSDISEEMATLILSAMDRGIPMREIISEGGLDDVTPSMLEAYTEFCTDLKVELPKTHLPVEEQIRQAIRETIAVANLSEAWLEENPRDAAQQADNS